MVAAVIITTRAPHFMPHWSKRLWRLPDIVEEPCYIDSYTIATEAMMTRASKIISKTFDNILRVNSTDHPSR